MALIIYNAAATKKTCSSTGRRFHLKLEQLANQCQKCIPKERHRSLHEVTISFKSSSCKCQRYFLSCHPYLPIFVLWP